MSALDHSTRSGFLIACTGLQLKVDLKVASKPWSEHCQIEASNDVEAVFKWLAEYQHKKNTFTAYKREGLRFLLWCSYSRGKTVGQLKKEDMEAYFVFLQNPPPDWCEPPGRNQFTEDWKPFRGHLSQSALLTAIRILNSLFNYLVQAEYLRANPIKLIKQYAKLAIDQQARQYQVWERILEMDEWEAVQAALVAMPERNRVEVDNRMRTKFLFALLYFLGLRIHEVVNHSWGSFRQKNGQWWFFVKGKGDKLGHVPVNYQLLEYVKAYRTHLKKSLLPEAGEEDYLLVSKRTKKPLRITQLYSLVKAIGEKASKAFPDDSEKQKKLLALSPHWLRHLAASHQDRLGMPVSMIKGNLRHQSSQTTQIYVHAEDDERFNEMQKMQMTIDPKLIHPNDKVVAVEYQLQLSKGSVNKMVGLSRLLMGIEQQVFKGFKWVNVGKTKEELLEMIKREGVKCSKIELAYQVYSSEVIEAPKVWADALQRQSEIWLFDCELQTMEVKEA